MVGERLSSRSSGGAGLLLVAYGNYASSLLMLIGENKNLTKMTRRDDGVRTYHPWEVGGRLPGRLWDALFADPGSLSSNRGFKRPTSQPTTPKHYTNLYSEVNIAIWPGCNTVDIDVVL